MAADDSLRVVELAERTGFWPAFTDDPVHDFMLREALIRKHDEVARAAREKAELDARVAAVEKSVTEKLRRGVMH